MKTGWILEAENGKYAAMDNMSSVTKKLNEAYVWPTRREAKREAEDDESVVKVKWEQTRVVVKEVPVKGPRRPYTPFVG